MAYQQPPPPAYGAYGAPQPQYGAPVAQAYPIVAPQPAGADGQPLLKQEGERFAPHSGCRDVFWSVLFVAHFIAIVVLAAVNYGKNSSEMSKHDTSGAMLEIDGDSWGILAITIAVGMATAVFWLMMIKSYASCLIYFSMLFSVAMLVIFGLFLFTAGSVIGGVMLLLSAGLNLLFVYLIRSRIAFSAVILTVVSGALKNYHGTFVVAILSVLVQAVWGLIWVLAAVGSIYEAREKSDNLQRAIYFFFLVSFYWTSQVISNIVHVTVAGTIASWYFLFPAHMPANPTVGAFKRAAWTSFGSIAFGSFIVAIIRAMRAMVRSGKDAKNLFVRCIVLCILNCLDSLVSYFNVYAFTQVAIYGKPYCEAAKDTWTLIKSVGIDAIINDDIIGSVLAFASLVGGCMVGGAGGLAAHFIFDVPNWGYWVLIAFVIGFAMTMICMEVVSSGVCALFVCFSEDPAALQTSKPEVYALFFTALTGHRYYSSVHVPGVRA